MLEENQHKLSTEPTHTQYPAVVADAQRSVTSTQSMNGNLIVTGDNNSITQIIQNYKQTEPAIDDAQLRWQIINYLHWVRERYAHIELRGVHSDGKQLVQLDLQTVYVPLEATIDSDQETRQAISLREILSLGNQIVVTGGPGCGKTTVLQHVAWTLPTGFFTCLLQSGHSVILLLDGLDEVPNESERVTVREAIEDLVAGPRDIRVIVTCRAAAYKGRSALGAQFNKIIQVRPLTDKHVEALVRQAYQAVYPTTIETRERQIEELFNGIKNLEDERADRLGKDTPRLIDSPLLVRMLLLVYLSARRLPEHRAELYMRVTDTLLWPEHTMEVYRFIHLAFQEFLAARYLADVKRGEGGVDAIADFLESGPIVESWWREVALLVVGYLALNALQNVRALVRRLIRLPDPSSSSTAETLSLQTQWAKIEIAATACHEWLSREPVLKQDVANQVAAVLNNTQLMAFAGPRQRSALADTLGYLGDPRRRVGTLRAQENDPLLPDIEWLPIHADTFIRGQGKTFGTDEISYTYEISRYPVTVAQYQLFVDDGGYQAEKYWTRAGWRWRQDNKIATPQCYKKTGRRAEPLTSRWQWRSLRHSQSSPSRRKLV